MNNAAAIVYILCSLTALICFFLLWRGYRSSKARLLLWSALCFLMFFIENGLLFLDVIIFPEINLAKVRVVTGLLGILFLLYGLIWEAD